MTNNLVKIEKLFTVKELIDGIASVWLKEKAEEFPELYFVISYPDLADCALISGYPKQLEFDFTE